MTRIDYSILNWIADNLHNPVLNKIMIFFTRIGEFGAVWILICALLLFSRKTRTIGIVALGALLFSEIFGNLLLKNLVARPRPFIGLPNIHLLIKAPGGYSFPSGHTTASFAAAFVFGRYFKKPYAVLTYILAALIAFSRLYLYVHFPTDILGGIVLGYLCALLSIVLFNTYKNYRKNVLKV